MSVRELNEYQKSKNHSLVTPFHFQRNLTQPCLWFCVSYTHTETFVRNLSMFTKKKVKYHLWLFIHEKSDTGRLLTELFQMLIEQSACTLTCWLNKNSFVQFIRDQLKIINTSCHQQWHQVSLILLLILIYIYWIEMLCFKICSCSGGRQ